MSLPAMLVAQIASVYALECSAGDSSELSFYDKLVYLESIMLCRRSST